MKKIYSTLLAALAICAVSCQEGPLETPEPETPQSGETMTFTASFGDTKVALNEDGVTPHWENNDAITIYGSNGAKAIFRTTLPEGEKASTATFQYDRGLNNNQDCPTLTSPYYAVYGHQASSSNLWKEEIHNIQIWKDQSVGDHYTAPMIAFSKNTVLNFKNAAALLKFTVNADNVQSVTVATDAQISGEGSCNANAEYSCYSNNDPSFKQVTLRGKFENGQTYHIVVAPTTIKSLKMYINGGKYKSVNKELKFERSNIYNLGTIENEVELTIHAENLGNRDRVHFWMKDSDVILDAGQPQGGAYFNAATSEWKCKVPTSTLGKKAYIIFTHEVNSDNLWSNQTSNSPEFTIHSYMNFSIVSDTDNDNKEDVNVLFESL